ncbi:MAG: acetate--CoA ligase alpha subunit [Candidatus Hydrothermarchaeales archaeon]
MSLSNLDSCFRPKNVAVIGASRDAGKVGNAIFVNLLKGTTRRLIHAEGFAGDVYPINPKAEEISGVKCYPSITEVPEDVDLAVIVIPSRFIPSVMEELPKKNVKAAVIISAGFSEGGAEGAELERQVLEIAKANNIRIIGPNCLGVMRTHNNLNASFADIMPPKGPISFVSQSGALCTAVIQYSFEEAIGFSNFVSIGNKSDVDDADLIEHFAQDPETKAIALYIESLKDGKKFLNSARKVIPEKPIVVLKSGRTETGAKAASSHTGSLAGSDAAYEAAFRQVGIYRVYSISELFDTAKALGYQPPARGNNIAIITNAGGPGVMAADQLYYRGLNLATIPEDVMAQLNEFLPPTWSHANPIDVLGDATPERYARTLELVGNCDTVDGIVVILTPQAMTNPMESAKVVVEVNKRVNKPLTAAWVGMTGRPSEDYLDSEGIPELSFPERAVDAMAALVHRGKVLKKYGKLG